MNNQELFSEIGKLIDAKSEESSCEKQNKILRELLDKEEKVDILKINIDESKEIKKDYSIICYCILGFSILGFSIWSLILYFLMS